MTQSVELPLARPVGNGVTTAFAANFTVFDLDDVLVDLRDTDDVAVGITQNGGDTYDYVVSGNFTQATERYNNVTVTFNTAPPSAFKVGLTRLGLQEQTLDLTSGGVLPVESIERRFDRLVSMVQDLQAQLRRVPIEPIGTSLIIDAGNARISNVAPAIDDNDVITKAFLGTVEFTTIEVEVVAGQVNLYRPQTLGLHNNATPIRDDFLSGAGLLANVTYSIEGCLRVTADTGGPGFRFGLSAPSGTTFNLGVAGSLVNTTGSVAAAAGAVGDNLNFPILTGVLALINVFGTVRANEDVAIDFYWGQVTSNAAFTLLEAGSWLRYIPVS